jgi:hypothetical protein
VSVSTCPRCKGPLTDTHRCPRRPIVEALEAIAVSVGGGIAALVIFSLIDTGQRFAHLDLWLFIAGSLAARGVHVYLRARQQ